MHKGHDRTPILLPRGFNTANAAGYIGWSESFLRRARLGKTKVPGPRFQKRGKRVTYLREDLDAFLENSDLLQDGVPDEH